MKAEAGLAWIGIIVFGVFTLILSRGAAPPVVPDSTQRDAVAPLPVGSAPPLPELGIAPRIPAKFSPLVRVNVAERPVSEITLAVDGSFRITPVESDRVLHSAKRLAATAVETTANGFRIGGREIRATRIEIVPEISPAIWVNDNQYRGVVRLFRQPDGRMVAVNVLPIEDYVASVLDSEMPAAFPKEARQAQAIVARTYAIYQMQEGAAHPYFDLFASTRSQKYLGVQYRDAKGRRLAAESASSRQATADTAGMVCTYQSKVFATYYTAVCGGQTTTGREVFSDAAPPLACVPCEWCRESPRYRWNADVSRARIGDALESVFAAQKQSFGGMTAIGISRTSKREGIPIVEIQDGKRVRTLSAADLRNALPTMTLPSPHFQVRMAGETVHFSGRGHGHGVGFCQWGARGQALAGRGPLDIVRYYYPGAEVVTLDHVSR
ncbi:MAG: SpoIID/LytB domain-containing protein [Planctomycetaceae bacterium]